MTINATGYAIIDNQQEAIWGVGETVDEAWTRAVAIAAPFLDSAGEDMPADEAYEQRFHARGATAALIAQVEAEGGAIAWGVVHGIACTVAEEEAAHE